MKQVLFVLTVFSFSFPSFASSSVDTCQTAVQIENHIAKGSTPAKFCIHTVNDPTHALKAAKAIPQSKQLSKGLKIAFLNSRLKQELVETQCAALGREWHPVRTLRNYAIPRASIVGNSLEALGNYLSTIQKLDIWSGSKEDREPSGEEIFAFYLRTADNYINVAYPDNAMQAVCVTP